MIRALMDDHAIYPPPSPWWPAGSIAGTQFPRLVTISSASNRRSQSATSIARNRQVSGSSPLFGSIASSYRLRPVLSTSGRSLGQPRQRSSSFTARWASIESYTQLQLNYFSTSPPVSVKPVSPQETDSAPAHGWFLKLQADAHILILRTGGDSCKLPKPRGVAEVVSVAGMERHVPS